MRRQECPHSRQGRPDRGGGIPAPDRSSAPLKFCDALCRHHARRHLRVRLLCNAYGDKNVPTPVRGVLTEAGAFLPPIDPAPPSNSAMPYACGSKLLPNAILSPSLILFRVLRHPHDPRSVSVAGVQRVAQPRVQRTHPHNIAHAAGAVGWVVIHTLLVAV